MPWAAQGPATDGFHYDVYLQDKDNSCACASIAMAARLIQNKRLDESTVRGWVAEVEGGFRRDKEGVREFDQTATARDLYGGVFQKLNVTSFPVKGSTNVAKWVGSVSRAHPAVISVNWAAGGGHAVLAVNVHNGNVIILDPGVGIVEIPIFNVPTYTVTYPGAGAAQVGTMNEMRTT